MTGIPDHFARRLVVANLEQPRMAQLTVYRPFNKTQLARRSPDAPSVHGVAGAQRLS